MRLSRLSLNVPIPGTPECTGPMHLLYAISCVSAIKTSGVCCRFGIGRFTTVEEVDYTVDKIVYHVNRLRDMR